MTIRVVIADDQPLMRAALRDCLSSEPDIEVLAEAATGREAVDLARRLRPDIALLDIRMPVMDGIEAIRHIMRETGSATRVISITTFDLDEHIVAALRAGASGFVVKDATPEELVQAVRVVSAGDALLSPAVTRRLLDTFRHLLPAAPARTACADLTPRERTVLELIARGANNSRIAIELHLAESSVKSHVSHLLAKLQAVDRVHLVIYAYETGLVSPGASAEGPR